MFVKCRNVKSVSLYHGDGLVEFIGPSYAISPFRAYLTFRKENAHYPHLMGFEIVDDMSGSNLLVVLAQHQIFTDHISITQEYKRYDAMLMASCSFSVSVAHREALLKKQTTLLYSCGYSILLGSSANVESFKNCLLQNGFQAENFSYYEEDSVVYMMIAMNSRSQKASCKKEYKEWLQSSENIVNGLFYSRGKAINLKKRGQK